MNFTNDKLHGRPSSQCLYKEKRYLLAGIESEYTHSNTITILLLETTALILKTQDIGDCYLMITLLGLHTKYKLF